MERKRAARAGLSQRPDMWRQPKRPDAGRGRSGPAAMPPRVISDGRLTRGSERTRFTLTSFWDGQGSGPQGPDPRDRSAMPTMGPFSFTSRLPVREKRGGNSASPKLQCCSAVDTDDRSATFSITAPCPCRPCRGDPLGRNDASRPSGSPTRLESSAQKARSGEPGGLLQVSAIDARQTKASASRLADETPVRMTVPPPDSAMTADPFTSETV